MEDQLVQILANTQSSAEGTRKQAELDLKHAQTSPAFPVSLANISSHASVPLEIRQSSLSSLRQFIERNWTGESDEGPVIPISDPVKEQVRSVLLEIALSPDQERKIKTAARYVENRVWLHTCLRPCFLRNSVSALPFRLSGIAQASQTKAK